MMKHSKTINVITLTLTAVSAFIYFLYGGILLKAATSLCFVLVGVANYYLIRKASGKAPTHSALLLCGLIFCFIGDTVINYAFIAGALVFALGHVFYIVAFCKRKSFAKADFLAALSVFVISAIVVFSVEGIKNDISVLAVCIVYAAIISLMAGKAAMNFLLCKNTANALFAIGAVLFFVSDAALLFYMFASAGKLADTLCLFTYFPAQSILAYAISRSAE